MANLQANHHIISISRRFFPEPNHPHPVTRTAFKHRRWPTQITSLASDTSGSALVQQRLPNSDDEVADMIDQMAQVQLGTETASTTDDDHHRGGEDEKDGIEIDGYLVREYGWKARRMVEDMSEMRMVARIQAEAFYDPAPFFDDFFFNFFLAEVLAGLLYRLRNSPPDRYACLVAEPTKEDDTSAKLQLQEEDHQELVGVVDVTVLRDHDVLQHLEGAQEYLYVSGIAVSNNYRRRKVATVLLKACEVISVLWGYEHVVLRAYEDDKGARALYSNAGYKLVSRDPPWVNWIGRKRRILMVKRLW